MRTPRRSTAMTCRQAIADYVVRRGWAVRHVLREESGALPIPLGGRGEAFWPDETVRIGMRAGLFHPTTGYSLPDAVATAELLAGMDLQRPGSRLSKSETGGTR